MIGWKIMTSRKSFGIADVFSRAGRSVDGKYVYHAGY